MSVGTGAGIAIGGGIAAGGSIAGAAIGSSAASEATAAQVAANRESIAFQREQSDKAAALYREYADKARGDLEPFRQAQLQALGQAQGLTDPNNQYYQQQRGVNTQAIQQQLAAQGLLRSKSQVDLLSNLELGLNQQRIGQVNAIAGNGAAQGIAGLNSGQGSALAGIYGNLGQQVGSSFQQLGQFIGQGAMAQGQYLNQGLQGFGNAIQGTLGNFMALKQQDASLAQLKMLMGK